METNQTIKHTFPVLGMSCAACAIRVDKTLHKQKGVVGANVNYAAALATVEYNPSLCSPESLRKSVQDAGYDLIIETDNKAEVNDAQTQRLQQLKRKTIGAVLLSIPSLSSACPAWIFRMPITSYGYYRLPSCSDWATSSSAMLGGS